MSSPSHVSRRHLLIYSDLRMTDSSPHLSSSSSQYCVPGLAAAAWLCPVFVGVTMEGLVSPVSRASREREERSPPHYTGISGDQGIFVNHEQQSWSTGGSIESIPPSFYFFALKFNIKPLQRMRICRNKNIYCVFQTLLFVEIYYSILRAPGFEYLFLLYF